MQVCTSWMAFIFPQWKYTVPARNCKILPYEFSKFVKDIKERFNDLWLSFKLINNRWAWGMVPKQEGGATNQTKSNEGYPWQPCERQPPHPSLQGAWRKKGPHTGWKRDRRPPTFQAPISQAQPKNKQQRYIPHLAPYYVWPNLKLITSQLGCCST